jgi:hypothetical protein
MTKGKTTFAIGFIIFMTLIFLCDLAAAKRVIGYTPPPYYLRFLISFFTLAPVGFITGGLSYYAVRYFDQENCIKNKKLFLITLIGLILMGAITGALDGLNDECWNPAMIGSISLSLIIPAALLILHGRFKFLPHIIISIVAFIPSLFVIEVVAYFYQNYTYFELGWPTAW